MSETSASIVRPEAGSEVGPEPEPVQLLTPDGELREHPDHPLDRSDASFRALYRDLVLTRRLDDEATALQRQGELGLWAPLRGQEAAQVGSARALEPQDMAFPTYREHGVALCRGVEPVQILGLFRGTTLGGWDPHEHRLALYTIVVGAQTLHAVGYAMGVQRRPAPDVAGEAVLAYFGDGASSQGDVLESFVWAASFDAPVVFFCTDNQWAISVPSSRQKRVPLARRAAGFGFPGVRVDGNDVLATRAVTRSALDRARAGGGPSLVEAVTYRMGPHTTSDDPTRYRDPAEAARWLPRDPLLRVRRFLVREQIAGPDFLAEVDADADALAETVRVGCRALPDPDPEEMFAAVLADEPPGLRDQREEHTRYLAELEEVSR